MSLTRPRVWVGANTHAVRSAASLEPIVRGVGNNVAQHTSGVESSLGSVQQQSMALARRLEAATAAHDVTVRQASTVATDVSRMYDVTAASLRDTKRLQDLATRRREDRTGIELKLQDARHKLLNVQRLLPRVQQQLQGHVTKAEARDMLAAIAQPEVAALQREIRAAGHRLQRMSLPRAGEAVPVDRGDRAGVGASSGGASDTAAAGGAGADAAHGSVDEAMTRAWKSVLGQVAASLESEVTRAQTADARRNRELRDQLERCSALTTKVESKLRAVPPSRDQDTATMCSRLNKAVQDLEASVREEGRQAQAVAKLGKSVATELRQLEAGEADKAASAQRERRAQLAAVMRGLHGGSGPAPYGAATPSRFGASGGIGSALGSRYRTPLRAASPLP